ncbi:MAG: hypothetical protein K2P92_01690 [Bdellovibrionaceae bacterium]|nr:hypothetical protein [Pseudobdellovibrionaceae bacterium]
MKIEDFLLKYPNYETPFQYYKTGHGWETSICFYNYFDQIFPKENISTALHLFYFDAGGKQIAYGLENFSVHESKQIKSSQFVNSGEGVVAVAAVPEGNIEKLAEGKFTLRNSISTGYYVVWENLNSGTIDISHELQNFVKTETPAVPQYFNFNASSSELKRKMIVINSHIDPALGQITPTYKVFKNSRFIADYRPGVEISGRGLKIVDLEDIAKSIGHVFKSEDQITVCAATKNVTMPMTFEAVNDQDFHIHHI